MLLVTHMHVTFDPGTLSPGRGLFPCGGVRCGAVTEAGTRGRRAFPSVTGPRFSRLSPGMHPCDRAGESQMKLKKGDNKDNRIDERDIRQTVEKINDTRSQFPGRR